MIRALTINDPTKTFIPWWDKVQTLSTPRTFEFQPGLNILWGRNGSGKTTVIRLLARVFQCEQSGRPVMTETSLRELFGIGEAHIKERQAAMSIDHDGQPVRLFDPSISVGVADGAFDWDFGMEGIHNTLFKGSSGQTTLFRFDKLIGELIDGKAPAEVERRIHAHSVNDLWKDRIKLMDHFLRGQGKKGPPTVLLDEPERSLDIPHQVATWRMLRSVARTTQIIVASHSLFALKLPGAHYIEMEPGYLAKSTQALTLLHGWAEEPIYEFPVPGSNGAKEEPSNKPSESKKTSARTRLRQAARKK